MPLTDDVLNIRTVTNYLAHDIDCAINVCIYGLAGGGEEQASPYSAA